MAELQFDSGSEGGMAGIGSGDDLSVPLTPRSRIQAMLDRIDNDEEDTIAPIATTSRLANFFKGPQVSQQDENADEEPLDSSSSESDLGDDDDELDAPAITREPRGKLAARLAQQGSPLSEEDAGPQSSSTGYAPLVLNRRFLKRKRDVKAADPETVELDQSSQEMPAPQDQQNATNLSKADRFAALVAKKRAEREAKEAEAEAQRQARLEKQKALQVPIEAETSDSEAEHSIQKTKLTLTQEKQDRPARKASKKALLEMEREQQRISRNMQLTHEAKTRKKISKDSFLAKFGLTKGLATPPQTGLSAQLSSSRSSSPIKVFDDSLTKPVTPPSSPPTASPQKKPDAQPFYTANYQIIDLDDDTPLPGLDNLIHDAAKIPTESKGKGKAPLSPEPKELPITRATIRETVRRAEMFEHQKSRQRRTSSASDDDDDLEIIKVVLPKKKSTASDILKNVNPDRQQQQRSMQKLRLLANLENVESKSALKHAVEAAAMKRDLQTQAKRQAAAERAERVESLRARGVVIQTQEERDKDQLQIEDMLEKARQEAEQIAKREKAAAKRDEMNDGLSSDDEDDDYVDEQSVADGEAQELELSGSEDEEEDEVIEDENSDAASGEEEVGDGEDIGVEVESADESADEDAEADAEEMAAFVNDESESEASETMESSEPAPTRRRNIKTVILDDDDDLLPLPKAPVPANVTAQPVQQAPRAMPFNPFAMAGAAPAPMGLTQAFAATMADTQLDDLEAADEDEQALPSRPPSPVAMPTIVSPMKGLSHAPDYVLQSPIAAQIAKEQASIDEIVEMPEATQDVGFRHETPLARRFVSQMPASIDTIIVEQGMEVDTGEVSEPRRKGRLMRRAAVVDDEEEDEEAIAPAKDQESQPGAPTAFDAMAKAARRQKRRDEFIKKRSKAGEMVQEQAEESEDEYAGLGGASDDDSDGEMDAETREMLDDRNIDVDESKLAAFHADKERQDDEAGISKLYNDITKGNLRRKRNAGEIDLSDSDDDIENRRRIKQREFARMRKALLQDEHVGKIAENPKNQAFMRAIEDRDEDADSWSFQEVEEDSQSQSQSQGMAPPPGLSQLNLASESQDTPSPRETAPLVPDSQNVESTRPPLKEIPTAVLNLFPRNARRTAPKLVDNRPTTIEQIRQSVSFLVEDSQKDNLLDASSDVSDAENDSPSYERVMANFAASRSASASSVIVDRVQQRIDANTSTAEPSRMAFVSGSGSQGTGFRVPSLLRRATSNLSGMMDGALSRQLSRSDSTSSASSRRNSAIASTERAAGGAAAGEFVRRGGTKKSSVSYFARENERRKKVEEIEKKRVAEQRKFVEGRKGVFGGLHTAGFE